MSSCITVCLLVVAVIVTVALVLTDDMKTAFKVVGAACSRDTHQRKQTRFLTPDSVR